MTDLFKPSYQIYFLLTSMLLISACDNNRNVPFPVDDTRLVHTKERPFAFADTTSISWSLVAENLTLSPPQKLNLDKIPSEPFEIGEPFPLKQPMDEQAFDWDNLPDSAFDFSSLPDKPIKIKTKLLQPPTIVKAGQPSPTSGATRGILDMGFNLGLPAEGKVFLKDENGLIWIGTNGGGLCRYDGTNLEIYGREQGLLDNNIWSLFQDDDKRIWIGSRFGINILDRDKGVVHELIHDIPHFSILSIMQDREGLIWYASQNHGVFVLDLESKSLKEIGKKEGLDERLNLKIFQDDKGLIWITSMQGLFILDKQAKIRKRITSKEGLMTDQVFNLIQDSEGNYWFAQNDGVQVLELKNQKISSLNDKQGLAEGIFIDALLQDKDGKIWFGTGRGHLYSFDQKSNSLENLKILDGTDNSSLVLSLVEDESGQIWIGTISRDSYVFDAEMGRPANLTKADHVSGLSIWSTLTDSDGNTWIGNTGRVFDIYFPKTKSIKHFGIEQGLKVSGVIRFVQKNEEEIIVYSSGSPFLNFVNLKKGTIRYMEIKLAIFLRYMIVDTNETMWICSDNGDVYKIENGVMRKMDQTVNITNRIGVLALDQKERIWIGSNEDGITVIDPKNSTSMRLSTDEGLISNLTTSYINASDGKIWIGTEGGISRIDMNSGMISNLTEKEGLLNNDIWTLNEFDNDVYVGTTKGLSIMSPLGDASHKWRTLNYERQQGLSEIDFDNNSGSFTKDGQFWAGVNIAVLTVIDRPKLDSSIQKPHITSVKVIDEPFNFYKSSAFGKALNEIDTLWTTSGEFILNNKQILIDSLISLDKGMTWERIDPVYHLPVNLQLPYNKNYFSFTYAANDLKNPNHIRYRYILEGIDQNWSAITSNTTSENYRDLPPGNYTFKVSSSGSNGLWSEPATFDFLITPPWWKTWWAYTIMAVLGLSLLRGYVSVRSRTLKRQNAILEEKVAIRTNALEKSLNDLKSTQSQLIHSEKMASLGELTAGIAHEIQNPLNFVNNFSDLNRELIEEQLEELDKGNIEEAKDLAKDIQDNEAKIIHHGKRAEGIVRSMLLHSRGNEGAKESTDLNLLCDEYLRLAFHGLRAKDRSFSSDFKLDLDQNIPKVDVIPQDMGRVLLNLINNAFHAVKKVGKPEVVVSTRLNKDYVEILIEDNGSGIPDNIKEKIFQPFFTTKPTGEGTGLGLSMSYDIITKGHNGKIVLESQEGLGTKFIISLPTKIS